MEKNIELEKDLNEFNTLIDVYSTFITTLHNIFEVNENIVVAEDKEIKKTLLTHLENYKERALAFADIIKNGNFEAVKKDKYISYIYEAILELVEICIAEDFNLLATVEKKVSERKTTFHSHNLKSALEVAVTYYYNKRK